MTRQRKRCALYTRKSSEEGLEQAFNSLEAQREACAAYVKSQVGEGWHALETRYDDGGFSGGSMDRPALARLLVDIQAGKVDVVVVYKIDRLTRSLPDFARMVEIFDKHEVSFVSVTQAFNTTTSMGRLTLNVLLSFAQFEREVTGERIRDKIAASKARGMWMGGNVPLGYDPPAPGSRALVINAAEAETVRTIFTTYLELGSVHALQRWLDARAIRSKCTISRSGRECGGHRFSRGALFHLLRNRIYLGLIVHKGAAYPGMHPAIIDADLFEAVQEKLDANARRQEAQRRGAANAPLTGRIFDAEGYPMSPTFSYGKKGKLYRYYVSAPLQQGEMRPSDDNMLRRIAAARLESGLAEIVRNLTGSRAVDPLDLITRLELHQKTVHCLMPVKLLPAIRDRLSDELDVEADAADRTQLRLKIPLVRRAGQTWVLEGVQPSARPDPVLVKALRSAHAMLAHDDGGRPFLEASPETFYRRRLARLAFLGPDLQRAILEGRQPKGLTLAHLLDHEMPLDWSGQARRFGFC